MQKIDANRRKNTQTGDYLVRTERRVSYFPLPRYLSGRKLVEFAKANPPECHPDLDRRSRAPLINQGAIHRRRRWKSAIAWQVVR